MRKVEPTLAAPVVSATPPSSRAWCPTCNRSYAGPACRNHGPVEVVQRKEGRVPLQTVRGGALVAAGSFATAQALGLVVGLFSLLGPQDDSGGFGSRVAALVAVFFWFGLLPVVATLVALGAVCLGRMAGGMAFSVGTNVVLLAVGALWWSLAGGVSPLVVMWFGLSALGLVTAIVFYSARRVRVAA